MLNVKNEKNAVLTAEGYEAARSLKPLKTLGLSDFDRNGNAGAAAQEPAAAAGSARLGRRDPARTASGTAPEDIAMAVGVITTALMLTYGNVIMEVLFRILGI